MYNYIIINSLQYRENLDWTILKASVDNKINVAQKVLLGKVENIMAKGENAGNQHFLLFPQYFH